MRFILCKWESRIHDFLLLLADISALRRGLLPVAKARQAGCEVELAGGGGTQNAHDCGSSRRGGSACIQDHLPPRF